MLKVVRPLLLDLCLTLDVCASLSQVNIQIDQGTDPMRITVAGQPHTVDTAATAVAEIINGGNPFGAGGPASLGGALRYWSLRESQTR